MVLIGFAAVEDVVVVPVPDVVVVVVVGMVVAIF